MVKPLFGCFSEWTQKYEDTIKEIQARNRDDIIDKIPGFECSARPEWPVRKGQLSYNNYQHGYDIAYVVLINKAILRQMGCNQVFD